LSHESGPQGIEKDEEERAERGRERRINEREMRLWRRRNRSVE
jgi:hypothetical protein